MGVLPENDPLPSVTQKSPLVTTKVNSNIKNVKDKPHTSTTAKPQKQRVQPTVKSKNNKGFIEPSLQEMENLYDSVELKDGYTNYGDEIIVLPIPLTKFWKLWFDDKGPQYADSYMKEKNKFNRIIEKTKWQKPSEIATFQGMNCQMS